MALSELVPFIHPYIHPSSFTNVTSELKLLLGCGQGGVIDGVHQIKLKKKIEKKIFEKKNYVEHHNMVVFGVTGFQVTSE